jgi:hypothetical protein
MMAAVFQPIAYRADLPPSMRYEAPVIKEALSDARNVIVLAIFSGVPTRLSGTVAARLRCASLLITCAMASSFCLLVAGCRSVMQQKRMH